MYNVDDKVLIYMCGSARDGCISACFGKNQYEIALNDGRTCTRRGDKITPL